MVLLGLKFNRNERRECVRCHSVSHPTALLLRGFPPRTFWALAHSERKGGPAWRPPIPNADNGLPTDLLANGLCSAWFRGRLLWVPAFALICLHGGGDQERCKPALSPGISGEHVVLCLDDRVAGKPAFGVVLLRWLIS